MVEQILRNDPTLRTAIRASNFLAWNGSPTDAIEPSNAQTPFMRITPTNQAQDWWTPSSQRGLLVINCEIMVSGFNVEDFMNLWWAIERAIYPADFTARMVNDSLLRNALAPWLVRFTQPLADPRPETMTLYGVGQIALEVQLDLNP